jgi:hypothetical protein
MTGDSAFRRLLLDTVDTTIKQSPSTDALIELLRITTPSLTTNNSSQKNDSYAKVRDVSQREKLFRTLQLRIHPDKHPGDERVTALFQEVTLFYQRSVEVLESEDRRQWGANNSCDISATKSRSATAAHGDYENANFSQQTQQNTTHNPRRRNVMTRKQAAAAAAEPLTHQAFAVISLLFPPLGVFAIYHSLKVRPSLSENRFADARYHSEQAYNYAWWSLFCVGCIFLYIWLGDGDLDLDFDGFDWDKMKHNFKLPWDDGP